MSFKKTKVVMLPTNEKANLKLGQNGLLVNTTLGYDTHFTNQHLYFLSDDEIKKGDWCYDEHNKVVFQNNSSGTPGASKKIIATTDKLRVMTKDEFSSVDNQHLPQPSKSFIEKYVKEHYSGVPIINVLVEYNHLLSTTGLNEEWLKVNDSDNTITIKKIKDSWTRDEVVNLLQQFNNDKSGAFDCTKWIEENL